MRKYIVYCHTNKINGKRYVGITSQKPEKRWGNGYNYANNDHFYKAIKKYGWEEFKHDILFTNLTKEEACDIERMLIAKWQLTDRTLGYNNSLGGEGADSVSEETRHKISQSKKGQTLSEESKRRMSASRTGAKHWASIPVMQCLDDGTVVAAYENSRRAAVATGIQDRNIRHCIAGKRQHAGGFVWKALSN